MAPPLPPRIGRRRRLKGVLLQESDFQTCSSTAAPPRAPVSLPLPPFFILLLSTLLSTSFVFLSDALTWPLSLLQTGAQRSSSSPSWPLDDVRPQSSGSRFLPELRWRGERGRARLRCGWRSWVLCARTGVSASASGRMAIQHGGGTTDGQMLGRTLDLRSRTRGNTEAPHWYGGGTRQRRRGGRNDKN